MIIQYEFIDAWIYEQRSRYMNSKILNNFTYVLLTLKVPREVYASNSSRALNARQLRQKICFLHKVHHSLDIVI